MKVAVQGCCHGQLDAIYQHISQLEARNQYKFDILLICGDFQAVRNHQDLECMAVPNKYKHLGGFYRYYIGEKEAPVLTIVIGGNHEASNYMSELYHGGWLAPKIYFLGCAGSVLLNGIRIAGASGIFKANHFRVGHYERVPYSPNSVRSVYHIREFSVRRLSLLPSSNIFLSHDWPQSIEHHGDLKALLQRKSFLREDIQKGALGSPPLMGLLRTLRPEWWFSAHLHTRYEALVVHDDLELSSTSSPSMAISGGGNPDEILINEEAAEPITEDRISSSIPRTDKFDPINSDEIRLGEELVHVHVSPSILPGPRPTKTKFLVLDKCLPRRQFLEVVSVDNTPPYSAGQPPRLSFDPEWLAITRAFHPWFSTTSHQRPFPDEAQARSLVEKEREWVSANVKMNQDGEIPILGFQKFVMTAPGPGPGTIDKLQRQPVWYKNPQTEAFCRMLDIPNLIDSPYDHSQAGPSSADVQAADVAI